MAMAGQPIRVLLVEDNPSDSAITRRRILKDAPMAYEVTIVETLGDAWPILDRDAADVVLCDLSLPDSEGLETVAALRSRVPRVPIVVLTGQTDEGRGLRAVQMGAQDYLEKARCDSYSLQRTLRYAVERHRFVQTLRDLSLVDDLTGLYNRRGLFAVSGKRLEVGQRVGCRAFVVFADLDHLKRVNDEYGHAAGDVYLQLAAEALRRSFRAADVVARVGGDEFVVTGLETTAFEPTLLSRRVQQMLEQLAQDHRLPHTVSISTGVERFDPTTTSLESAVATADATMYEAKRSRRPPP